jgi:hypothetical protein
MTMFKSWPLDNEENKRVDAAVTRAMKPQAYFLTVIHLMSSIMALYYIMELKSRIGKNIIIDNDAEIPELVQDIETDTQTLSAFESEYLEIGSKQVKTMLEPLRQVITDLDPKYAIAQRKKRKDDIKEKLRETYNSPKGILSY